MFAVSCALEAQDLYYAVLSRIQVVDRMIAEARERERFDLTSQYQTERNRLDILRHRLEEHIDDHDYHSEQFYNSIPKDE